jgi:hypothetical protein
MAAGCDRNKPYDNAPNYDEPGCKMAGGKVELPPESATNADGGFQSFLDQGCATGIFLGYAIVQGTSAPVVGLCCSM